MTTYTGKLQAVTTRGIGVEVAADSTGDVVQLRDGAVLDPTGGVVAFEGVEYPYVSADPDGDEFDTVTLAAPLSLVAGDRLELRPVKALTVALVRVWDDAEPIPALVPLEFKHRIPEGVRDDASTAETVTVEIVDGSATVTGVVGDDGAVKTPWPIVPGGAFIAGDPDGAHAALEHDGLRVWHEQDGMSWVKSQLTTEATSLAIYDSQGSVLGGITSGGDVTGATVSTDNLAVRGVPFVGKFFDPAAVAGWLDRMPWGKVASAGTSLAAPYKGVNTETVYLKVSAKLRGDRTYRVTATNKASVESPNGVFRSRLRVNTSGADPTTTSPELDQWTSGMAYGGPLLMSAVHVMAYSPGVDGEQRFCVTYEGKNGSRCAARAARIFVEDIGPYDGDGAGGAEGSTKVRYTTTWDASAAYTYDKTGARITSQDGTVSPWYWFASPTEADTPVILFGGGAVEASHSVEAGKTIGTALSGAIDVTAQLVLKNHHWYGDEKARIAYGQLGAGSLPSTLIASSSQITPLTPGGDTITLNLPPSWFTGSNRGVVLGEADGMYGSVGLGSGEFGRVGDPDGPQLILTYTR